VRRHAPGEYVPCRHPCITRGHSLYLDGVPIPVEELVSHRPIARAGRAADQLARGAFWATCTVVLLSSESDGFRITSSVALRPDSTSTRSP
jgi:hypothetical protein